MASRPRPWHVATDAHTVALKARRSVPGGSWKHNGHTKGAREAVSTESREVCHSLELPQVLPLNVLPNFMITLTPSNKYRDEEHFVFRFLKDLCDPCHQRPC